MAVISKKDKLIEDAQKLALRGQLDKAVKAYEQILALDPTAIAQRQKFAELLIKCGRTDDARKELETIGKYFSKNGFYLKAIAVYKQLQKFFPTEISLSIALAELNGKHGLVANALSEYKLVYEIYEKDGNHSDALNILDKMQNIDPQNIPLKIKLAECYTQHGKMNESYVVFTKAANLLLERSDNATFSKVCARVQKLFPEKPGFIFAILTEQINQGNAAITIGSLQSLLRSNPNNKQAWELIILAYKQAEEPQRVKLAYQHYLKFFPTEPAAMLGHMSCATADKNFSGAMALLEQYETTLISGGFLEQLNQIYHDLDKLDPINLAVLEGLIRIATAAKNENEVCLLKSKHQSLLSASGKSPNYSTAPVPVPAVSQQNPLATEENVKSPFFSDAPSGETASSDFAETVTKQETILHTEASVAPAYATEQADDDVEIDIDIDIDSPFDFLDQEESKDNTPDNWLDSIGELFDTISTAPRGVKFGNEVDGADAQSHFDLGQAFKEMGLYDEAINEFREASQDTEKKVECLIMQCACLRERGDTDKAISMLLALLKPVLSADESCAVKYELASAYESSGKVEEANNILNEINATNPDFRDIRTRLSASNNADSLDFSDEDFLDF